MPFYTDGPVVSLADQLCHVKSDHIVLINSDLLYLLSCDIFEAFIQLQDSDPLIARVYTL